MSEVGLEGKMPVLPREGANTRARTAAQEQSGAETEAAGADTPVRQSGSAEGTSGSATQPPVMDLSSLLQQMRVMQEEQARRQEEQARRQEQQLQAAQKDILVAISESTRRVEEVEKTVQLLEHQCTDNQARISKMEVEIEKIQSNGVQAATSNTIVSSSGGNFKVPPFDGTSSWMAYKLQFEAVKDLNGWTKSQAKTALTLALRDKALTVLEALGGDATYEQLLEALESRYGDLHLEHVFRAQLRDRCQRANETLQQWSLEVEKLVRKAYQTSPSNLVDSMLLQAFVDGIYDAEVRAAVRLGHHGNIKEAVAHALEVEAVRRDPRYGRVRQITSTENERGSSRGTFSPRCYNCGERGHLRSGCPNRLAGRRGTDAGVQASEIQEN